MESDWTDGGVSTEEHESGQGPEDIWATSNLIKTAGATEVNGLFQVCEPTEQEGKVPEQWVMSYTIQVQVQTLLIHG